MKILYAASNHYGSKIQLFRFLKHIENHQLKIAAYKISSPKNINIDWTLNCLLSSSIINYLPPAGDNLEIYYNQIKSYKPDLIISDLEFFTSYIAKLLNIPLWQYSSMLLNHGLVFKRNLGVFKFHAHILSKTPTYQLQINNIIDNSDRNLINSHFVDLIDPPQIKNNFEWIRPYHQIGKSSIPCQHNITAALSHNYISIINKLKNYPDSVAFAESNIEKYNNIIMKNINNQDEYYCNLYNSKYFVCQGQSSFLADAFYNGKFSIIYPNYQDAESIVNSQISYKFGLGEIISLTEDIEDYNFQVSPYYKNSIKYLHEEIEKI